MIALEHQYDKGERIRKSREGVKRSEFEKIRTSIGMSQSEISKYLMLSTRAIQNKDKDDIFSVVISERILAINGLYEKGSKIFGNKKKFLIWMDTENYAIGGVKPKTYLDLMEGIELILDQLGAIEHGFST